MDFRNIHHLREILVTDADGNSTGMMQYSSQRISRFRPDFVPVPFKDQLIARELYLRSGGRRRDGVKIGMEVILEITAEGELAM